MSRSPFPAVAPDRVLIVRISAMGDLVFASPLAATIKARWPECRISWLVTPALAGLLDSVPGVDEVIPWTPPRGLGWLPSLRALRRQLAERDFDWVIDAQGLLKSRALAAQANAWRVGFDSGEPGKWWLNRVLPKGGDVALISSEYRFLAEQLTGRASAPPRLVPAHTDAAADCLQQAGLAPGWVALCPFTTRPQKHWPEEYWPALMRLLAEAGAGPVAVLGGPDDSDAADAMIAAAGTGAVNLAGRTPVKLLPGVITSAGAALGVDTGLTHIGIATGRPTVAIFGSTRPYLRGGNAPFRVLYDALPCAPCQRRPTCAGHFTCLRVITPERVLAALRELVPSP